MSIINQDYYNCLLEQIDKASSCAELQVTASVVETMQKQIDFIAEQLEKVNPLLALLEAPTSPDEIIEWIKGLIENVIKPLTAPALTYQSQTAYLVTQLALTIDKVNAKANEFTNCEIVP